MGPCVYMYETLLYCTYSIRDILYCTYVRPKRKVKVTTYCSNGGKILSSSCHCPPAVAHQQCQRIKTLLRYVEETLLDPK